MSNFFRCFFSPALYRIYNVAQKISLNYEPNLLERVGDFTINYVTPIGCVYAVWHRNFNYMICLVVVLMTSFALRAAGRAINPTYCSFLHILERAKKQPKSELLQEVRKFDFDFSGWPNSYKSTRFASHDLPSNKCYPDIKYSVELTPQWLLGWIVAHTFGIRMIYPGKLLSSFVNTALQDARSKLVIDQAGIRARVDSADGNYIDTMFFDRRQSGERLGKTLVICCEGNAGFYEVGIIGTPLNEGYSVLGWNHPGFGGSSGTPYPGNELNAAEAVFDFAVNHLGFAETDIILYAWSIGGYPATYLASKHRNIKGLVLDATFDDVIHLAIAAMPPMLSFLVKKTIRSHVNLHISNNMEGYKGPVHVIRRTEDEIIADPPKNLKSNRGNNLLKDILKQRYPELYSDIQAQCDLDEWLSTPRVLNGASTSLANKPSNSIVDTNDLVIPHNLSALSSKQKSDMLVKIAERMLTDFKSSHCIPLPGDIFQRSFMKPPIMKED